MAEPDREQRWTFRAWTRARRVYEWASSFLDGLAGTIANYLPSESSSDASGTALAQKDQIKLLLVGGALIIVALGIAPAVWGALATPNAAPPPQLTPGTFHPTEAQWATLGFDTVSLRPFAGLVVTDGAIAMNDDTTTPVYSPYSGRVTRLLAKPGDVVRTGDPLMVISATEAAQGQADLNAALGTLSTALAQQRVASANEARQHQLYAGGSAALRDWQQAQSDLAAANASVHTAQIALAAQRNKLRILGMSAAEVAAIESRAATPPQAEVTIRAPIAGTITQRQVGLGQFLLAGSTTPVYSIGNLSTLWVIGQVRETDAPAVSVGQTVDISVASLPHRTFKATLSWVASAIDPTMHRLAVRAEVQNPDGILKPLMFATMTIHVGKDRLSTAVPANAVIYEGEAARVWLAAKDRSLGLQQITVGRSENGYIEALNGLRPGNRVVTSGAVFIDRAAQPE